jgi:hypothetical protein
MQSYRLADLKGKHGVRHCKGERHLTGGEGYYPEEMKKYDPEGSIFIRDHSRSTCSLTTSSSRPV